MNNFSAHDLAIWLGILFFLVGGVNQVRQLWIGATGRFSTTSADDEAITRKEFNDRIADLSIRIDKKLERLDYGLQRMDRRVSRTNASLSQLIGVIAAREKVQVALPTEEDLS